MTCGAKPGRYRRMAVRTLWDGYDGVRQLAAWVLPWVGAWRFGLVRGSRLRVLWIGKATLQASRSLRALAPHEVA